MVKLEKDSKSLADKILDWERNTGESFTDYFMHDNVKNVSWAFWLLGRGYSERANMLINLIQAGNKCIEQSLLYEINLPEGESVEELYKKDVLLWAEFLTASDRYFAAITAWFEEQGEIGE